MEINVYKNNERKARRKRSLYIKTLTMKDFAAIDFETANNERSSVCSVGIVVVRNGEIVDKFY